MTKLIGVIELGIGAIFIMNMATDIQLGFGIMLITSGLSRFCK